ncbi:hypothetical protein Ae168Ps1_2762c [Pseudonocardia sp. Ae168_Ps1]|uniref:hypothetical protein n=1 Tax=unclassified Pseudonocardia TaxID=2619320 RepID=UPI00094B33A1|nr:MULTISPECIES: hypothetical protein [unclassified Pseudonocardia]OLL74375.1 hypothetical protein Ae150APs1_2753c [Pseudonocardia sp. Ae150A_Ps1]OLL80356.1 hypothetical protein Ae168Ps1_2762c [Pseudonocardia sp. Ae168_Ps1]OLL85518.1 hypothetical protein Ae263Ps1_2573 [Pseudonocardia sp. Ae263_Ps1]OLL94455.1 hypothetical protein Ae356Ps1_4352c [Pseudonocardia sp. Ae356_Ps1]
MDEVRRSETDHDDPREEARNRRAAQADHDADARDRGAERLARAAKERDDHAADRDRAAAARQAALLAGALPADHEGHVVGAPDADGPASGGREQAEVDREVDRSMLDAARPEFAHLIRQVEEHYIRRTELLHELRLLVADRAAAAEDRRRAAADREAAGRDRVTGAADRARGAADRDQREIEQAQRDP